MKKPLAILLVTVIALAIVAGSSLIGFNLGWKHGRFDATSLHSILALNLAKAMDTQDREKERKLMAAILGDIEANTLGFDDTWTVPYFRHVKASVILDLDSYWRTGQRIVPFGSRVDESNTEKYGLIGGRTINSGRDTYETMYSNAVRRARERLKK